MSAGESPQPKRRSVIRMIGLGLVVFLAAVLGLVGAVFAISESAMKKKHDFKAVALEIQPSPELVERGRELATYRGCRDCHGENLAGRIVADDMPVMRLAGPNITPSSRVKDFSDQELATLIRHGVRPDGTAVRFMPSYEYVNLSHGDLAAIISYVRSVPPADGGPIFEVGPVGRMLYVAGELPLLPVEMIDHDTKPANPTRAPTAEYGKYLATACSGCHGANLTGGPIPGVPPDWPEAPNLTPHETGMKAWSFDEFKTALRTGKRPDGTEIKEQYMPWKLVGESPDDDLMALWKYLRTMDPKAKGT